MGYLPIGDYGIIGNMHTAALVGRNGSVDWLCYPRFDSPSVFGRILDDAKGGYFRIAPAIDDFSSKQFYWPDTNVLVTRFFSDDGAGEVTDFMPIGAHIDQRSVHLLIRRVNVVRGSMPFHMECRPAFNYTRSGHRVRLVAGGAQFHSDGFSLGLAASRPVTVNGDGACSDFTLQEGETAVFEIHQVKQEDEERAVLSDSEVDRLFRSTVDFWRRWLAQSKYRGRWREIVNRSALVLKLLIYVPTGAIIAAPTTSLPESIGGPRNWDYRYTWIRDAAFTLYSLIRLGFVDEALQFMNWVDDRCQDLNPDGSLSILYSVDGHKSIAELELPLDGYKGSRPVRCGNAAFLQLQLDIYGELMDAVYLSNKYGPGISYEQWSNLRRLVDWVCENWDQPDDGIWEVRSGRQPFVYSRMMCWVAVDRGLRLALKRSFPADHSKWIRTRDQIYQQIQDKGWNPKRKAYVQFYGSDSLDASVLLMPLVFFCSPTDPRMLSTIDAIRQPHSKRGLVSNGLVYRYNVEETPDGFPTGEGTFNICTFWLVEALTRAGQKNPLLLHEARLLFEEMLGYASHLGLYAEQTSPRGDPIGNFPQALTHLSLISAAFNLDRALGEGP